MTAPFRFEKIGYAALAVSDLSRSVAFYTEVLGLELVERSEDAAFLRCSADHHNIVLEQAAVPGLVRVAFQLASPADWRAARAHFVALGLPVQDLAPDEMARLRQSASFRVREPRSGLCMEFYAGMLHLPRPFDERTVKIARLGHVLISVPNWQEVVDSLTTDFGFVVSDYTPGQSAFMRCFPNPFHHSFGVVSGDRPALHHVNFMVRDIDDIGRSANRLQKAGVEIIFGPGRHYPSGSVFLYFADPDGFTLEYSFEMEEIPEHGGRPARILERSPDTADLWGGAPKRPFGTAGVIL